MATYLVTGGAGFIGGHIVERLVRDGHKARIIDDFSTGLRSNLTAVASDVEVYEGCMLDSKLLNAAAKGVDGIFHLAAIASVPQSIEQPIRTHQVNSEAVVAVLEAAKANDARVVFSSSSAVYGDGPEPFKTEDLLPRPITPYAVQKLSGEGYLQTYHRLFGVPSVALRYFNVFGKRQNPASEYAAVIPKFIARAQAGQDLTIFGDGSQTRDFVHVYDVVDANLRAMTVAVAEGQPFNIGCGVKTDLNELAASIVKVTGANVQVLHGPERPGDIKHSCCTMAAAKAGLGWNPHYSLESGLSEMIS
jgi:nucleoside-diphosphate-sugar epimerase